ncbi:MAG: oxygen-independent coproporphyrinogen III oxidase [Sulfitobacter sp.]|nr:oxygen-independent coproporphyrinogen III oxidase [Sulfitobacter sp.]
MTGAPVNMSAQELRYLGLFDARIPRYTSYPPANIFSPNTGAAFQADALSGLDPAVPVSVYVHSPFCERLCWFCACRTQGTQTLKPVEAYLGTLEEELRLIAGLLPAGLRMGRLHWGGGTPTILPPALIKRLADAIKATFAPTEDLDFSVEIDPTLVDQPKIDALVEAGLTRASIGIQDFAPEVQEAIGRRQSFEQTRDCVAMLRRAGVTSLNADLVYGLPYQTEARLAASLEKVLALDPDRVALFGYAHVPHMSKRQRLIPHDSLPEDDLRHRLSTLAADRLEQAGLQALGIDHFAKPDDSLARAAQGGHLRRNFQGYTEDTCPSLIGLGASSISQFAEGFVQNAPATSAYRQRIEAGRLAGFRGHTLSPEDQLRKAVIEGLMCDFSIDLDKLRDRFGGLADGLVPIHQAAAAHFGDAVRMDASSLRIIRAPRQLARLVAHMYDENAHIEGQYSRAS